MGEKSSRSQGGCPDRDGFALPRLEFLAVGKVGNDEMQEDFLGANHVLVPGSIFRVK